MISGPGPRPFRWVVLALATVMQLGLSLPQQTPAALGPVLTHALGLSRAELGLLTSAIWGGMLLGMLPAGVLADRHGERRVILAGGLVLAACLLLAAQTSSFLPLFGLLIPAAIGASSGSPGGTRALAAWFSAGQRGLAMGVRQTGVTGAGVVAALLLPPIALRWGWEAAFRTVAGLSLLSVLVFAVFYRESGSGPAGDRESLRVVAGLARNRNWLAATGFGWFFMGALGCAVTYLPAAVHEDAGLSPVQAGMLLALLQVGGIAGRLGWGILSDRLATRGGVMLAAGLLAVLSCLAIAWLDQRGTPLVLLAVIAIALGLSCMGWNALYITLSAEMVPERSAATAVGAGTTVTFTGMFAATPVFGLIADHTGSYTWAWLALAAWALAGSALALGIRDRAPAARAAAPSAAS